MYIDRYRFPDGPQYIRHGLPNAGQWPAIFAGYRAFEDRESRAIFRALLIHRYLSPEWSAVTHNHELAAALNTYMDTDRPAQPLPDAGSFFGMPIMRWPVEHNGRSLHIDMTKYGTFWTAVSDQYFFRRGDFYVGAERGDRVLDCGSFVGDTAVKFAAYVGETGRVFSFDPLPQHVALARKAAALNGLSNIEVYCCGVAETTRPSIAVALETPISESSAGLSPGNVLSATDHAVSIDDFCRHKAIDRIDYLKMDIEGSETAAVAGAHETISRFRPKLAICLYHRPSDLWTIPNTIKRLYPFYRMQIGHHSLHAEETVMYARAR